MNPVLHRGFLPALLSTWLLVAPAWADEITSSIVHQCAACHGTSGRATNPQWPNLAGQKGTYLAKQLRAFRDGTRTNNLMSPVAAGLNDAEIADLSAYYSQLSVPNQKTLRTGAPAAEHASGRNSAAACVACHGSRGISANEEWPNIAGQQAGYLAKQLADFRDGRRDSAIMSRVAAKLSDSEIELLAGYLSALELP